MKNNRDYVALHCKIYPQAHGYSQPYSQLASAKLAICRKKTFFGTFHYSLVKSKKQLHVSPECGKTLSCSILILNFAFMQLLARGRLDARAQ